MKKLCFISTTPAAMCAFMKGHIRASAENWSVSIISHPNGAELLSDLNAAFIPFLIERKPAPFRDLVVLIQLITLFRRERFGLVHSITPKAGLLAMLAAWITKIPNRMHTFTGQVWVTKHGWKRIMLKMFDKLIVFFATNILVDSPSQLDFLVSEGVISRGKGIVLGCGSICGVDTQRFHFDAQVRSAVRAELNIGSEQTLILFLGRLNHDKGILDLANSFAEIASTRTDVILALVGAEEDLPFADIQQICWAYHERLRRVSFTPNPERYMVAADIFCLPSYREGFGQVIIEAAACGVPTVASRIYGIKDAIEDEKTGILFPAGDVAALMQALLELIEDQDLRQRMGETARQRALKLFSNDKIISQLQKLYEKSCDDVKPTKLRLS